jgi:hypothetical protein
MAYVTLRPDGSVVGRVLAKTLVRLLETPTAAALAAWPFNQKPPGRESGAVPVLLSADPFAAHAASLRGRMQLSVAYRWSPYPSDSEHSRLAQVQNSPGWISGEPENGDSGPRRHRAPLKLELSMAPNRFQFPQLLGTPAMAGASRMACGEMDFAQRLVGGRRWIVGWKAQRTVGSRIGNVTWTLPCALH